MKACHRCGRELKIGAEVARNDSCPGCYSDLKCCLNCRLHDPGAHNQCREPQAEWQTDKEKANFCEFFDFRETASLGHSETGRPPDARAAFDALFGPEDD